MQHKMTEMSNYQMIQEFNFISQSILYTRAIKLQFKLGQILKIRNEDLVYNSNARVYTSKCIKDGHATYAVRADLYVHHICETYICS